MVQRRKVAIVTPEEVPAQLRDIISTAERWGIWNPHQCGESIDATSTEELRVFVRAIEERRQAIDDWLDQMPTDMEKWPKAAETFLCMIRTWHEAACELYAREKRDAVVPDAKAE